jgi:hypothetical protein
MRFFILMLTITIYLFFSCAVSAQPKNGFAVEAAALNWSNFVLWNTNIPEWEQSKSDLMNPAHTFGMNVTRVQKIGRHLKGQQVRYGLSLIYQNSSYEKPWLNTTFPHVYKEYLSNTNQFFVGLNMAYRKEFLFDKRSRNRLRPFIEPEIIVSYGVCQRHLYSNSVTDQAERTEPIDANNFVMFAANICIMG